MTGPPDDQIGEEVREETIEDLIESNDFDDLTRMRCEMRDELEATTDDREIELLEYRLGILKDGVDRLRT